MTAEEGIKIAVDNLTTAVNCKIVYKLYKERIEEKARERDEKNSELEVIKDALLHTLQNAGHCYRIKDAFRSADGKYVYQIKRIEVTDTGEIVYKLDRTELETQKYRLMFMRKTLDKMQDDITARKFIKC